MSTTTATDTAEATTDPVDRFPQEFRDEIRRAQAGIIAGANALDPTFAIAHARTLRSAIYRAEQDAKRLW